MSESNGDNNLPYIIDFSKIGNSEIGYISVAEKELIPFSIKRVYWAYYTPDSIVRGHHAHHGLEQVLIAVSGKIIVQCELINGYKQEYVLDKPNMGLYMPTYCWHTMKYEHNSVQMCIANMEYDEKDYIRDYSEFKNEK